MQIIKKLENMWQQLKYQAGIAPKEKEIGKDIGEKPENYILGMTDQFSNLSD